MTIDVLVADDHAIIRDGLRKILADTSDFAVAGEAANGNTALDQVIKDGTWSRLQEQYYPGRPVPADFKPGSGTVSFPKVKAGSAG